MKSIIAIPLLFIYLGTFLVPFFPYVEYALNKDFIANELCVNQEIVEMNCEGKCYLGSQLVEAVGQGENTSDAPTIPSQTKDVLQPFTDLTESIEISTVQTELPWMSVLAFISEANPATPYQPPQA